MTNLVKLIFLLLFIYPSLSFVILDKWPKSELTYKVKIYSSIVSKDDIDICLDQAFSTWSRNCQLDFSQEQSDDVDIDIVFDRDNLTKFNDNSGEYEDYVKAFSYRDGGKIIFKEVPWVCGRGTGINLLSTALHSVGHVIGLGHVFATYGNSIMHPAYRKDASELDVDDIAAAKQLYGARTSTTTTISTSTVANPGYGFKFFFHTGNPFAHTAAPNNPPLSSYLQNSQKSLNEYFKNFGNQLANQLNLTRNDNDTSHRPIKKHNFDLVPNY